LDNERNGKKKKDNVARMGERRGAYRVLVGKPEGKKPLWKTQSWMEG